MAQVKNIRALDRGLLVLELLGARNCASLHELHQQSGLSKATLLRILKTLEERKWVHVRPDGTAYSAMVPVPGSPKNLRESGVLGQVAVPVLDELSKTVIWPSDLGVRRGDTMCIVEHSRRNAPFVINRDAVGRRPRFLQSALGRAYLAFCPDAERKAIMLRLARSSHPDDRRVHAGTWVSTMIEQTRMQGYGAREPGYWAGVDDFGDDVNSIAVPLMNRDRVIACLNMIWIADAMSTRQFVERYLGALRAAADRLARRFMEASMN